MIEQHFPVVAQALGQVEAVCSCHPAHAQGGTGSWWMNILNLIGIVKVRYKAVVVYLALRGNELVHLGVDDDGEVCDTLVMPLEQISGASASPKGEYEHQLAFSFDGTARSYTTCAYLFGQETPAEIQGQVKQMEEHIVAVVGARA